AARSTVDIDLTVQRVAASASGDQNQIVREMLQSAADVSLRDWFEFVVGPASMDLTAAPYGGARYPVEARMDERTFARFHLDAGIGDVVSPHPWKRSSAGTGWDSPASSPRGFG